MKILLVHNYYPVIGGGEDSVVDEERRMLEREGHDVVPFMMKTEERGSLDFILSALCLLWNPRVYRRIRRVLRTNRPDLVHCHNTFPLISPSVYWACHKEGVPVVQTLHNYRLVCANGLFLRNGVACEDCSGKAFAWPAIRHRCYRESMAGSFLMVMLQWVHRLLGTWNKKVDRYIALTEFSKSRFTRSGVVAADKVCVKPNFIDDALLPEMTTSGTEVRYAVFIGRLWPEKGCRVLVEAWIRAHREMEDMAGYELLVVGDGPERARVEQRVQDQASDSGIRFMGAMPRPDVIGLLQHARFLVLPSICYEGFPMTIVEAYACGVPIVAAEIGNMVSLVENHETGLLFEVANAGDLADRIKWAIQNEDAMVTMGKKGRLRYEQRYTQSANYECLMDVYAQL